MVGRTLSFTLPGAEDHDSLASGLLQLDLDRVELLVDDLHHPLDLLWSDGTRPRLLSKQVHHVSCELLTTRVIPGKKTLQNSSSNFHTNSFLLFKLLVVDISNLVEFCFVLAVHDRGVGILLSKTDLVRKKFFWI